MYRNSHRCAKVRPEHSTIVGGAAQSALGKLIEGVSALTLRPY